MSRREPEILETRRESWGSRSGFVLAAVGSAVGLGNLWGFPYKAYSNGGGAFLLPYLVAMLLIGVPLLILEFSLGHMTQRAAPDAFRGINRKTEPIGWWGIGLGFVIITYYPVVLAYCGLFLYECIRSIATSAPLPWAGGVQQAETYFLQNVLNSWTSQELAGGDTAAWSFGRLIGPVVLSLVVVWLAMYFCIFRGVKLLSRVVLWTVPIPWAMLAILALRGLTLDGSLQGLNFYLEPDWQVVARPETWRWAFGQMFFSMSLAFGVMITYASFLHRKSDLNNNAAIIGLADVGTSFVAGLAVFGTLGAMAFATQQAGHAVGVEGVVTEGPGLAFVVFPYALAQLPGAAWFGAVFFIALLTLGIDSGFSITESVLASVVDKTGWRRSRVLVGLSLVGLGFGLVYCTRGGLSWLGAMDDFINSSWSGIALVGLLQCVVVGWGYRISRLREHANERSDWRLGVWWDWTIRFVAPVLLALLFTWSLLEQMSLTRGLIRHEGVWQVPNIAGLVVALAVPTLAVIFSTLPSPRSESYAVHLDEPRFGRRLGMAGMLLAGLALVGVAVSFVLARAGRYLGNAFVESIRNRGATAPEPLPPAVANLAADAWPWAIAAGLLAVAATVLGAWGVRHAERTSHRPSGFARGSAGWGVLALGAAAGVMLSLAVLRPNLETAAAAARAQSAAQVAADAGEEAASGVQGAAAQAAAPVADELSGISLLVLAAFSGLIVIGLAWCFYRAIKAATPDGEPQLPEGVDEEDNIEP